MHEGLDALQVIEASAQSVAVLMGARLRQSTGGAGMRASGMLVGAKDFTVTRAASPGEVVEVEADLGIELGPLQLYRVVVHGSASSPAATAEPTGTTGHGQMHSGLIASGELKVAATGGGA